MNGDKKYFDFGSSMTFQNLTANNKLIIDSFTALQQTIERMFPVGATFMAGGNIECPLCFRPVTIETRYNTEGGTNSPFLAHIATMREVQFYCAAGCGFLATYIPATGGHSDKMQLVSCPDEPEPTRMQAMEDWARNATLFVRRRP